MVFHNIVCVLVMSSLDPFNVYTIKKCLGLLKKRIGLPILQTFYVKLSYRLCLNLEAVNSHRTRFSSTFRIFEAPTYFLLSEPMKVCTRILLLFILKR